jgi:hypothetical protein
VFISTLFPPFSKANNNVNLCVFVCFYTTSMSSCEVYVLFPDMERNKVKSTAKLKGSSFTMSVVSVVCFASETSFYNTQFLLFILLSLL